MHMFTASAQDELILTNTGMNSSRRMNWLYNDTVLYSLAIKKAARILADLWPPSLDQPFTPLTSTLSIWFSNPLVQRKCTETLTFQDSVRDTWQLHFSLVVCKYLWTSLFIPRLLPQAHLSWSHVLYLNPYYFKLGRRLLFNWLCIQNQPNWFDL